MRVIATENYYVLGGMTDANGDPTDILDITHCRENGHTTVLSIAQAFEVKLMLLRGDNQQALRFKKYPLKYPFWEIYIPYHSRYVSSRTLSDFLSRRVCSLGLHPSQHHIEEVSLDKPADYRITVQGVMPEGWLDRLGGLRIAVSARGETTLEGRLTDQAALNGVLDTLYELHLPLLEVTCLSDERYRQ